MVLNIIIGADIHKPDWKCLKEFMMKEGPIKKELVVKILRDSIALLSKFILIYFYGI